MKSFEKLVVKFSRKRKLRALKRKLLKKWKPERVCLKNVLELV
jgi:hypothetical protein